MKIFISAPIRGLDSEQTKQLHKDILEKAKIALGRDDLEEISILPDFKGFDTADVVSPPVYYLGNGLSGALCRAEYVIFYGDLSQTRGCKVEKLVCDLYEIPYLHLGE